MDSVSKFWEDYEDYITVVEILGRRKLSAQENFYMHLQSILKEYDCNTLGELWLKLHVKGK